VGYCTDGLARGLLVDGSRSLLDLDFIVVNKLDGETLSALEPLLTEGEVLCAHTQMGRLLRQFHQIRMEAFGYIVRTACGQRIPRTMPT
jgi:hypothetical protein